MNGALRAATDPFGRPRFYPYGQHPATARLRAQLAAFEGLPESPNRDEMIDYLRGRLAAFEMGETRAKADYLRALEHA